MLSTILSPGNEIGHDVAVAALTAAAVLALLRFWDEIAKRGVFDQKVNRKLVHISVGLVFMLFWPFFSDASWAPYLAAFAPGINAVRVILVGAGILKNDAMVKAMSRHGDYRELLKGPLYYGCIITTSTAVFWRASPIAVAAICNLCAGDGNHVSLAILLIKQQPGGIGLLWFFTFTRSPGVADIVGRRFGTVKLPYNKMKSYAGTMSMAIAGFLSSVVYAFADNDFRNNHTCALQFASPSRYLYYYSIFGLCDYSWRTIAGLLVVSLTASVVESLPISTELDDNLTVPLSSMLVGGFIF